MSNFNPRKVEKNISFQKGASIFNKGDDFNKLFYLTSGAIEYFYNDLNGSSKRITSLSAKRFLFPYILMGDKKIPFKVIASSDCTIDAFPFLKNPISFIRDNKKISKVFLNSLLSEFNVLLKNTKMFLTLYYKLEMFYDNCLLYFGNINNNSLVISSGDLNEIIQECDDKIRLFKENSGFFPPDNSLKFFDVNNGRFINKEYKFSLSNTDINVKVINTILSYVKLNSKITDVMISDNPDFIYHLFQIFSEEMNELFNNLTEFYEKFDNKIKLLLSNENNLVKTYLEHMQGSENSNLIEPIIKLIENKYQLIASNYKKYFNIISPDFNLNIIDKTKEKYSKESPKDILSDIEDQKNQDDEDIDLDNVIEKQSKRKNKLKMSKTLTELIHYVDYDDDQTELLVKPLNVLLKSENKFSDNDKLRKARKLIKREYWELYSNVLTQKFVKKKKTNKYIENFLKYGILDERLVSKEHYKGITKFKDNTFSDYSIYNSLDWIKLILDEKREPSINDLGQSFKEILREDSKKSEKHRDKRPMIEKRLAFELDNIFAKGARILTDSPLTALPFFVSEKVPGEVNKSFITNEEFSNTVNEIINLDYSLFFKLKIFRTDKNAEIYQQEVLPEFIRVPVIGSKVVMWQEQSGRKGPARFIVPMFFTGNLKKSLIQAFGTYRWEYCKAEKGPSWTDPVEGGITGKYFDYINFYKKSMSLSLEAKQKIKETFAKYRTDREKFQADYFDWLEFESRGIIKVNAMVREILITEIPFPKKKLEELKRVPVFDKLIFRFFNKRRRLIQKEARKFRKYEDENGQIPEVLQKYLDMLKK